MNFSVVGLDLSITGTGVVHTCAIDGAPKVLHTLLIKGDKKLEGLDKPLKIVEELELELMVRPPNAVIIEGYAFGTTNGLVPLVELGTLVRMMLRRRELVYYEVAPTKLKKFVAGTGNAKKELMMKALYKRWRFDTDDNNIADAFGLSCVGLGMHGMLTLSDAETKILT